MKYLLTVFLFFSAKAPGKPAINDPDIIIGKWMNMEEKNIEVEVYRLNGEYKAKIIWFDDSDDKSQPMAVRCDVKNPDKTLRGRRILGLDVMYGLRYNKEDDQWEDGHIYDPSTGKDWNSRAWINESGNLKVRGYWHVQLFGQNMSFQKVL